MQSENVSKYIVVSNGVRYCPASISSIPLVATSELHPDLLNAINFICGFESKNPIMDTQDYDSAHHGYACLLRLYYCNPASG